MKIFFIEKIITLRLIADFLAYLASVYLAFITVGNYKDAHLFLEFNDLGFFLFVYGGLFLVFICFFLKPYKFLTYISLNRIPQFSVFIKIIQDSFKITFLLLGLSTVILLMTRTPYSRGVVGVTFLFYFTISIAISLGFLLWMRQDSKQRFIQHLLIVGKNPISEIISHILKTTYNHNYQLEKMVSESSIKTPNMKKILKQLQVDIILICSETLKKNEISQLINLANDRFIKIKLVNHFSYDISGNPLINKIDDIPFIDLNTFPLEKLSSRILKRMIDLIASILVIVFILSWLTPLLTFLLGRESSGGVFYRHFRTGREGRKFICLKYRSMYPPNYSRSSHQKEKIATADDERITPIGKFLRKRHLDELPQFINVFRGDMSLVGPRPHVPDVDAYYKSKIDSFHFRYFIKPGITGLAQILFGREKGINFKNIKILKQKIKLDTFYLNHWSLLLDIKIIFLTIILVIWGDPKSV